MILDIRNLEPKFSKAVGATLAGEHIKGVRDAIVERTLPQGEVIVLDFKGIETTNSSYLRGTALWLLRCGQLNVRPDEMLVGSIDPAVPRPYDVYCVLANLDYEMAQEVEEFFRPRPIPVLVAREFSESEVHSASLIGNLEPMLKRSLALLSEVGETSASEIHTRCKKDVGISVTAWNNRLADLCLLRLVRRRKEGKQWIYKPISKEISYG